MGKVASPTITSAARPRYAPSEKSSGRVLSKEVEGTEAELSNWLPAVFEPTMQCVAVSKHFHPSKVRPLKPPCLPRNGCGDATADIKRGLCGWKNQSYRSKVYLYIRGCRGRPLGMGPKLARFGITNAPPWCSRSTRQDLDADSALVPLET